MENSEQQTPMSIFSALGIQNPDPAPADDNNPASDPINNGDKEPNPDSLPASIITDDVTFKASDLKSIFGDFESIDSVKEKYSMFEEKSKKYEEFEPFIREQETLMQQLESPFANEKLANLNSFIKGTGINDLEVANKFVGKNTDEIKQNPVQVMALAQVIQEPDLLKTMTFEEICDTIAEENNTYSDVTFEDAPKTMKMKLGKNVNIVEEKLQNIGDNKDFVASLREQFSTKQQSVEKLVNDWKPIAAEATKIREIEVEVDGLKIKSSVSEQTMNQIQQEVLGIISSNPLPTDEQNVKAIQTYVRNRAEALEAKSIYKSLISAVKGEARESALKEFHNGSEVVKLEKPDAQSEKSQLQRYFESQM